MYTCIYIYKSKYVCMYIYICGHTHVDKFPYLHTYVYIQIFLPAQNVNKAKKQ